MYGPIVKFDRPDISLNFGAHNARKRRRSDYKRCPRVNERETRSRESLSEPNLGMADRAKIWDDAIAVVRDAVNKDEAGEYRAAYDLYQRALRHFIHLIRCACATLGARG